ncbi:MAG: FHA domain-containing protein [Planctomycetes bacterium]|nr:FHA domain-containing protein [Planctomycetota bacterium]
MKKPSEKTLHIALHHLTGHRKGMEERFSGTRVSIGRGKNNHCSFDAERERSVSHRHCEIRVEDGLPILYDIGSLNGTYVNGRRIRRTPLANGDELGLGREGPRIRFAVGSDSAPADAAAEPAQEPAHLSDHEPHYIGATAEERQPLSLSSLSPPRLIRRRVVVVIMAVIILGLLFGGFLLLQHFLDRIETLENRGDTGDASDSRSAIGASMSPASPIQSEDRTIKRAPAVVPAGPRRTVVRLLGVIRDDRKRFVDQETLGCGVVVRTDGVATTYDVYIRVKAWLRRGAIDDRHDKILLAAPGGSLAEAKSVESRILHPQAGKREDGNLVLLLLEEGARLARVQRAAPQAGALTFYPPWEAAQTLRIRQLTNADKGSVKPESATLLAFDIATASLLPAAGTPLFSGDELIGISCGRDLVGWAISSVAIKELLDHSETATAELITSSDR